MTDEENISTLLNSETDWGERWAAKWVHFTPKEFSYYNNVAYKIELKTDLLVIILFLVTFHHYSISSHISTLFYF